MGFLEQSSGFLSSANVENPTQMAHGIKKNCVGARPRPLVGHLYIRPALYASGDSPNGGPRGESRLPPAV